MFSSAPPLRKTTAPSNLTGSRLAQMERAVTVTGSHEYPPEPPLLMTATPSFRRRSAVGGRPNRPDPQEHRKHSELRRQPSPQPPSQSQINSHQRYWLSSNNLRRGDTSPTNVVPEWRQQMTNALMMASLYPLQHTQSLTTSSDAEMTEIRGKILRAKAEGRTVSTIDSKVYIDYQYVGSLPSGHF